MPFIPPSSDFAPENILELCRTNLRESLHPYFKGKNSAARLENAVNAATNSIAHMLTMREVRKSPLGATVMTESASANKRPGSAPRTI